MPKTLRISTCPMPNIPDSVELEMAYNGREIGALTLHTDDFADFVESLRAGFTVTAEQKRRDVADFAQDVCDSEDD